MKRDFKSSVESSPWESIELRLADLGSIPIVVKHKK